MSTKLAGKFAEIIADIRFGQLRLIEINRPGSMRTSKVKH